jgi:hypothetical protein
MLLETFIMATAIGALLADRSGNRLAVRRAEPSGYRLVEALDARSADLLHRGLYRQGSEGTPARGLPFEQRSLFLVGPDDAPRAELVLRSERRSGAPWRLEQFMTGQPSFQLEAAASRALPVLLRGLQLEGRPLSGPTGETPTEVWMIWGPQPLRAQLSLELLESPMATTLENLESWSAADRSELWSPVHLDVDFDGAGLQLTRKIGRTFQRGWIIERMEIMAWLQAVEDRGISLLLGWRAPKRYQVQPRPDGTVPWWAPSWALEPIGEPALPPQHSLADREALLDRLEAALASPGQLVEAWSVPVSLDGLRGWGAASRALSELLASAKNIPGAKILAPTPEGQKAGLLVRDFQPAQALLFSELAALSAGGPPGRSELGDD